MKIQVKKNIDQLKKTEENIPKIEQNKNITEEQIKTFLREYEYKNLSLNQMYKIYAKNAMTPYFKNTLKSALVLIFLPSLTNLYYTFRPNSPLSSVMPFGMFFICLGQYFYVINKDLENFCFTNTEDSKQLREKYKTFYAYSIHDKVIDNVVEDILELEEKEKAKREIV